MKKLLIIICSYLLYTNVFAWSSTGHEIVANIATDTTSIYTLSKVNSLLSQPLTFPDVLNIPSYFESVNPTLLAAKLNTLVLASSWSDAISLYGWKNSTLNTKYANIHYINALIPIGQDCGHYNANQSIKNAIKQNNLNIVNAINSSIKSLISNSTSNLEKQVALRYLIHLVGDIHQPLHSSDPTYIYDSESFDTYGGNSMKFSNAILPIIKYSNGPNESLTIEYIANLHTYWDGTLGLWINYPDPYNSSQNLNAFSEWSINQAYFLNSLESASIKIENLYVNHFNKQINEPNPESWAQDSLQLSCSMLSNLKLSPTSQSMVYTFNIPIDSFQTSESYAVGQQLYLSGVRLAYLLTAIFDPIYANPNYITYIKSINDNNLIPTLFVLTATTNDNY